MSARVDPRSNGYFLMQKFDPGRMDFLLWLNSFEYTFDLKTNSNCSKVEALLDLLEPSVQSTLVQIVAPANVEDLSYDQVIDYLEILYYGLKGEHAANQRFLIRDQFIGETVIHYMNALWKIAEKCSPSVRQSTTLINRLRKGLIDEKMKEILNDSENIEFSDALMIAENLQSENNPN